MISGEHYLRLIKVSDDDNQSIGLLRNIKYILRLSCKYFDIDFNEKLNLYEKTSLIDAVYKLSEDCGLKIIKRQSTDLTRRLPMIALNKKTKELALLIPNKHFKFSVHIKDKPVKSINLKEAKINFSNHMHMILGQREDRNSLLAVQKKLASYFPFKKSGFFLSAMLLCFFSLLAIIVFSNDVFDFRFIRNGFYWFIPLYLLLYFMSVWYLDVIVYNIFHSLSVVKNFIVSRFFILSRPTFLKRNPKDIFNIFKITNYEIRTFFIHNSQRIIAFMILAVFFTVLIFLSPVTFIVMLSIGVGIVALINAMSTRIEKLKLRINKKNQYLDWLVENFLSLYAIRRELKTKDTAIISIKKSLKNYEELRLNEIFLKTFLSAFIYLIPLIYGALCAVILYNKDVEAKVSFFVIILSFVAGLAFVVLGKVKIKKRALPLRIATTNQINENVTEPKSLKVRPTAILGNIELNHVYFHYKDQGNFIFKDFSMKIDAKSLVLIRGPSGRGKTTLLHLLMAAYFPTSGQVSFDGQDVLSLDLSLLRQSMGVISQESKLIAASIYENVMIGRVKYNHVLKKYLRDYSLFDELVQHPLRLHTYISSDAARVSSYERALILLLRALIHEPTFLYLDEIFVGMDKNKIDNILAFIRSLPLTSILISHAPLKNEYFDQVIDL